MIYLYKPMYHPLSNARYRLHDLIHGSTYRQLFQLLKLNENLSIHQKNVVIINKFRVLQCIEHIKKLALKKIQTFFSHCVQIQCIPSLMHHIKVLCHLLKSYWVSLTSKTLFYDYAVKSCSGWCAI